MSFRLIAEIGCNHQGNFDLAQQMALAAIRMGRADVVKFQKRHIPSVLTRSQYEKPHPNPQHSFAENYGKHREFLEFSIEQHARLKAMIEENGGTYCSSVWDLISAQQILELRPKLIKVPSACNMNFKLLDVIVSDPDVEIHISLGMTTSQDVAAIGAFLRERKILERTVLYACTSIYPTPAENAHLLELLRLKCLFQPAIQNLGYSGHHQGINIDVAAFALGARNIERHFTFDKKMKGTDHALSILPSEFSELRTRLEEIEKGLTYKPQENLSLETAVREKLRNANA